MSCVPYLQQLISKKTMDEVTIEPQIEAQEEMGMMQIDTEPFNDEKDSKNEVKGEFDLVGANLEPYEGMEFESEEAARDFYGAYARNVGFRIRISRYTRSRRDNSIISRLIVCSKEGFRESRGNNDRVFGERKLRQRAVTRVGCKAMLMVKKLAPEKWVVSKFVKEHNHGPVTPRKVHVRAVQKEEETVEVSHLNVLSEGGEVTEPFEGMEFDSEEDARTFYINYARQMGFRARISKYCRSRRDNSIISRQIVCSKEGFREVRVKKEESDDGRVKRPRVITRIGCKAMIIVKKLNTGKWVVSRFVKEHNHALGTLKEETLILESSIDSSEKGLVAYIGGDDVHSNGGIVTSGGCYDGCHSTSRESLTVLYNKLCHEAVKYAQDGAVSEEIYNVAMSALKEAVEKVAAAKRSAGFVAKGDNAGHRSSITKCSNEVKKAVSGSELMLVQQPVKFVLIPSSSLTNDSNLANHSVESSMMLNMPNVQGINIPSSISVLKQSPPRTPSVKASVDSGTDISAAQNLEKADYVGANQLKTIPGNGIHVISKVASEPQTVAFPALPVTFYMPMTGSLSESSSVSMPGTGSSNAYALVAASVGRSPLATNTESHLNGQLSETPVKDQSPRSYTGPNPQVHATAIAAGARIIPPEEAASLIKAIEARIRSSKSTLTSANGFRQLTGNAVPGFLSGDREKWGSKDLGLTHSHAEEPERSSSEEIRLNENGGLKEIDAVMMDKSAVDDGACEDHPFSDGSS